MRTVLVGNRALAKHALNHMVETGWNVVGAVTPETTSPMALGQAGFEPFDDVTAHHGIPLIETTDINDEETARELRDLDPDLCVCPGWSQIISEEILDVPSIGFVGFHASRLPAGRGGAPVNWTIIHGHEEIALSLFYYTPGVDAGDVIEQQSVSIEHRDDVQTVLDKLAVAARDILEETRPHFESGRVEASQQALTEATYRPRRTPQDGLIDWDRPASALYDWIRAQTSPYPGAYTFRDGRRLTIWRARPVDDAAGGHPGEVVGVVTGEGVDVATGDGRLRLERVQPGDGPARWADEWARRAGVERGDRLATEKAPSDWLYTGIRDGDGGTDYATNVAPGETGTTTAVAMSPTGTERLEVTATFDGESVREKAVRVDGRTEVPVEYRPDSPGTHSLAVEFHSDGERIDRRYLKVFSPTDVP